MLRTSDLEYDLPPGAIATAPSEPRDAAKLMIVRARDASILAHACVRDLPGYLSPGDLLVLNSTRVLQARFLARRGDTGGSLEGLFLGAVCGVRGSVRWRVLLGGGRLRERLEIDLLARESDEVVARARLIERDSGEPGGWIINVTQSQHAGTGHELLERIGHTPLPPYIRKARVRSGISEELADDRERYQTIFAHGSVHGGTSSGSVAAPTAGLHFTQGLFTSLQHRGVLRAEVILDVGTGTFRTVETEYVEQHPMHAEWCVMPRETSDAILRTRQRGGRVICVGTTAARTVEAFAGMGALARTDEPFSTDILITPGYAWRWTDVMMTNFHLPRSTLMAMVASLLARGAGLDPSDAAGRLIGLYQTALREGYRFYSFGDAMLILP